MTDPVALQWPATLVETADRVNGVALVTIDRPKTLNALDRSTMTALVSLLRDLDAEPACRCIVVTGAGERAFAAGADIREMVGRTTADVLRMTSWHRGTRWPRSTRPPSRPSGATAWAVASSWLSPATCWWPRTTLCSACRR